LSNAAAAEESFSGVTSLAVFAGDCPAVLLPFFKSAAAADKSFSGSLLVELTETFDGTEPLAGTIESERFLEEAMAAAAAARALLVESVGAEAAELGDPLILAAAAASPERATGVDDAV
jgi:hypothetical protein